jgi:hypothetical protein
MRQLHATERTVPGVAPPPVLGIAGKFLLIFEMK